VRCSSASTRLAARAGRAPRPRQCRLRQCIPRIARAGRALQPRLPVLVPRRRTPTCTSTTPFARRCRRCRLLRPDSAPECSRRPTAPRAAAACPRRLRPAPAVIFVRRDAGALCAGCASEVLIRLTATAASSSGSSAAAFTLLPVRTPIVTRAASAASAAQT